MLPFLFIAYLLIEFIERRQGERIERALAGGGRWGFAVGALLGCAPQCGFSAMAANFYGSRVISLGALMAVFIATSDEAVPLLMAVPERWPDLAALLAFKVLLGAAVGAALDLVLRRRLPREVQGGYTGHADEVDCHEHHEEKQSLAWAAAVHTVNIFLWVLALSVVIGLVIEGVGEENFTAFLTGLGLAQPLFAALLGLVPNCASSVLLTQLYLSGSIGFSAVTAGLAANAGVGLLVLFRANPSLKQNLFITALLWVVGAGSGMVLMLLGF
ncbi:MAG TPA: arsenic efflux protein [Candidatus Fournierella merdipullorum]|uniref:Arsenic efflux protein n=1 Tax=Candidatus Allofournierella merdipullorum TaxID=2838595 RepID=A0A9D2E2S2_9FIRM|nr:arsenic efflux protein [Candidatus Fournierella merdipullorum]